MSKARITPMGIGTSFPPGSSWSFFSETIVTCLDLDDCFGDGNWGHFQRQDTSVVVVDKQLTTHWCRWIPCTMSPPMSTAQSGCTAGSRTGQRPGTRPAVFPDGEQPPADRCVFRIAVSSLVLLNSKLLYQSGLIARGSIGRSVAKILSPTCF